MAFDPSIIPSLIGLGTKIATAVPGLKKARRTNVGSRAAAEAVRKTGAAAVGGAQTGFGASRGLALRSGLRAASAAAQAAAPAVAQAARADEAQYEAQKQARNQRLASFGGDLAKGLGDMAASTIGAKRGEAAGAEEAAPEEFMTGEQLPGTGVSELPMAPDDTYSLDDIEQQGLDPAAVEQQSLIDDAGQQLQDFRSKREEAGVPDAGPRAAFQVDPTTKLIENAPPRVQPEIEQQLADKLHMKELALAEAERLGLGLDVILPRLNRRFGLRPGQSSANPFGVSLDTEEGIG